MNAYSLEDRENVLLRRYLLLPNETYRHFRRQAGVNAHKLNREVDFNSSLFILSCFSQSYVYFLSKYLGAIENLAMSSTTPMQAEWSSLGITNTEMGEFLEDFLPNFQLVTDSTNVESLRAVGDNIPPSEKWPNVARKTLLSPCVMGIRIEHMVTV